ncbi:MAG TPA: thioredoxin [Firmicutes bacterium]|jgi:thioredoxin 1|uniref:thioredoxin family protein n=1 Tax=Gelria sp. Kuro-4 TaxID=2796927 RepID=UPI0019A73BA1|nr:thioredoxin domain-containing protein [Gelria sp. Kuro-4]MDK2927349.1 thioredoxin 1 [Bacillota bacterium]BCV23806.1 thioredoxin [Gelria sp. Kuro-4]HHV58659.1 thioredoxin [Bacillota bacterium]
MSDFVTELTRETYEEEVKGAELPVLVDFWGPRCAPCLALLPEVEKLAQEYSGRVKFCKVNCNQNRRLVVELKVMALPTFLFYKGGEVVAQLSGPEATKENIKAKLDELAG